MKRRTDRGMVMVWSQPTADKPSKLLEVRLNPWWRFLPGARRLLEAIEKTLNHPGVLQILTPGPEGYVSDFRDGFIWHGLLIPAVPSEGWVERNNQAVAEIRSLLIEACSELEHCRFRGDARPHDGTEEIHSDGEPPIAYVIDRIDRMLGDER